VRYPGDRQTERERERDLLAREQVRMRVLSAESSVRACKVENEEGRRIVNSIRRRGAKKQSAKELSSPGFLFLSLFLSLSLPPSLSSSPSPLRAGLSPRSPIGDPL